MCPFGCLLIGQFGLLLVGNDPTSVHAANLTDCCLDSWITRGYPDNVAARKAGPANANAICVNYWLSPRPVNDVQPISALFFRIDHFANLGYLGGEFLILSRLGGNR